MDIPISLHTDSDGFVSQECPACLGRFKTKFGEGSAEPISFCPYCSHLGRDCWWTPEQAEYIRDVGQQAASELISKELGKMAKDFSRKSGSGLLKVKMDVRSSRGPTPTAPSEPDLDMPIFEYGCCGEHIKYSAAEGIQNLCCIICGKDHPLSWE
jgi:hypothetical protein